METAFATKMGVPLEVLFQAAVNPVRQETQAMVSDSLEALGIDVEIVRVRVDDFFSADPQETDSLNHFYADMQVYSTGNESPDPSTYMGWWTCEKMASQANQWQQPNNARYCNLEYDRLWAEAKQELDPERRTQLYQQLNQLLVEDVAVIPVVHRAMANAVSNSLTGVEFTPWDASTWAIYGWQRQSDGAAPAAPETSSDSTRPILRRHHRLPKTGRINSIQSPCAPFPLARVFARTYQNKLS
jgi:peptide/nickel transport system substrate-binding protein